MPVALALLVAVVAAPAGAAAGNPSRSDCAGAWNRSAAPSLHRIVASSNARGAFIDARASIGTDTWSKSGSGSSTSLRGCSIEFVLPNGAGVLAAWGAWHAGTVRSWFGPVRSRRTVAVPRNARVHSDGTIGFTG